MKSKKKPSYKIWIYVVVISLLMAVFMTPALKLIYPLEYEKKIDSVSKKYNLDKYLVMGIISAESNFESNARSHKDAHGLMQLTDETALWCIDHLELDIAKEDIKNENIELSK